MPPIQLIDTRVVHQHGAYCVLANRERVTFRDGTHVYLHDVVVKGGTEDKFYRALVDQHLHQVHVFRLEETAPELSHELLTTHAIDIPGLVYFTLRGIFKTADAFLERARDRHKARWFADSLLTGECRHWPLDAYGKTITVPHNTFAELKQHLTPARDHSWRLPFSTSSRGAA